MRRNPVVPVAELLLEPGEVRLDKGLASQDHSVGEVPNRRTKNKSRIPSLMPNRAGVT